MTDRNREGGTFERVGESMGEAAGRVAGRVADTAFNATGQLFNSMASMLGSWWSSAGASQAADSFSGREDACRDHFRARSGGSGGSSYERSRPLYQFGHVAGQNPGYQGRSFSEVEPDLRRAWETGGSNELGRWEDVRDYVGYGYGLGTGSPGVDERGSSSASHGSAQGGSVGTQGSGSGSGGMSGSGRGESGADVGASGRVSGSLDIDDRGVRSKVDFDGSGDASGGGRAEGREKAQGGFDDPLGGGGI